MNTDNKRENWSTRAGWTEAARRMREQQEDGLLDKPVPTRFDVDEWEW